MEIVELLIQSGFEIKGDFQEDVEKAQERLGLKFSIEFKKYLVNYGQLSIGYQEITGISPVDYLDVVNVTEYEKRYVNKFLDDMYVVCRLEVDGIVIWQRTNGEVYQTVPGGEPEKIQNSFVEYLEKEILPNAIE